MYRYLSFLLLIIYGFSYSIQAETLLELYQLAQQNDPQLKMANQEYLATLEKRPQARASLLPQLTLGANATENWRTENWMSGNDRENTTLGYNVSLRYALYRRDLKIQLEQADSQIKQAELTYEAARQALMERLSTRYFEVLAAHDNLKFEQSAKQAFKRQLDEAQQRFEVGLIAITDVEEAQAGYDLAVANEILAQNERDNAQEALREITGTYHRALATLKEDTPLLAPEPADIDKWTEIALEQNPYMLAVQFALETARQEVKKQRAANWPTLDWVAQHSYNEVIRGNDNPSGTFANNNNIGIQLIYFLYDGGAIRSRTKEAQQRRVQALEQLEQQRRVTQSQTRQAYWNLQSNISRVKALKQALVSSETALKSIQTGFELGTRTSVDVVNAQRDLLRAQRNYSSARYDYVLNTLRLKQAAGLLSSDDLVGINHWLKI